MPLLLLGALTVQGAPKERLSRADSFFGVHFDFHAEMDDPVIGSNTTPAMVQELIRITRPDYFEVDTKGHPGVSSYPTRVGNHAGRFAGDPLRVWRDETARAGVALYGHHSGILDHRAWELHPEWAAKNANGTGITEVMSVTGPYADRLLIPQLRELACDYGLDGAWLDGESWGMAMDYSSNVVARFTAETGIVSAPRKPSDAGWMAWRSLQRKIFREYERHVVAEVKRVRPDFQFCCNWSFSFVMPEAPCPEVDFISGDICAGKCVDAARYSARLFATQEVPWDLMSWSFYEWARRKLDNPATRKPAVQLMREAACVISLGGGYQAVFSQAPAGSPPVRDGSVDVEKVRLFGEVADFCRARQPYCFKARPIPQIGVLLSTHGTYERWDRGGTALFWGDPAQEGIVSCLVENQLPVTVLVTQRLLERLEEYPVVVVCEYDALDEGLVARLAEWVRRGGRLFVAGESTIALFAPLLDGTARTTLRDDAQGRLARHVSGKGAVVTLDRPISSQYRGKPTDGLREVVGQGMRALFPDPLVTVTGSHEVDVALMRTPSGEIAVNLVNTSGPHRTATRISRIDPVGPVEVRLRLKAPPKDVRLQPGNRSVACEWMAREGGGELRMRVDRVPIHEILLVRER